MDAYWLLKVHNDVDWTEEEALGGEVTREVTLCADCECSYAPEHFAPGRLLCKLNNGIWKPGDFCSRGVPVVPVAETTMTSSDAFVYAHAMHVHCTNSLTN